MIKLFKILLCMCCFALSSLPGLYAYAELYKWYDKEGVVHFSNTYPENISDSVIEISPEIIGNVNDETEYKDVNDEEDMGQSAEIENDGTLEDDAFTDEAADTEEEPEQSMEEAPSIKKEDEIIGDGYYYGPKKRNIQIKKKVQVQDKRLTSPLKPSPKVR